MSDPQELERLREEVRELRRKLNDVERRLWELGRADSAVAARGLSAEAPAKEDERGDAGKSATPAAPPIIKPPPLPAPPRPAAAGTATATTEESIEVRLGTYWAPGIG